ncbi:unnamed protein product [Leuciscus chuanchicus]
MSHCPLWFSLTHPAPLSPSGSAPGSSGKSSQGPGLPASYSPALAGQSMVSRSCVPPRRASSGASCQEGPSVPSRGLNISPPPSTVEPVGLASEGAQLIESGLSTEVVETILQSRAPSTRKLYALKWRVFTSWCSDRRLDPVNCPIGTVLEFLQDRFTAGLTPSTLKVYVAAIGAYHILLSGMSVGKDPLVSRFLRGTWRLRPAVRSRVPPWDLSIALQGLSLAPFEPIEEVPEKFLTLKALFLLAISSLKRIGDLQALSVAPSCLEFAPGMVKAFLHPRPGYIPKVPTNVARPIVLQAFCPPPFQNADQEANNLLCPVRALDAYVHRAALWRKSDQLFVCFGSLNKGGPVSKQRMSKWVVEAISVAYEAAGQPSPLAVRSHSTRSMAASKALISGVSLQDVCDAAGWSSPHTFVRFYSLDLDSTPGSQAARAPICCSAATAAAYRIILVNLDRQQPGLKFTLMGFIWVAVKAAFVCRQACCIANLFTAEYTGTVTFTGTERARSCHRNRERQHAGVYCRPACITTGSFTAILTFPVGPSAAGPETLSFLLSPRSIGGIILTAARPGFEHRSLFKPRSTCLHRRSQQRCLDVHCKGSLFPFFTYKGRTKKIFDVRKSALQKTAFPRPACNISCVQSGIKLQLVITSIPDVIVMSTGMAGTGCSTMVKVPRCQSHVLVMACVALITHCLCSKLNCTEDESCEEEHGVYGCFCKDNHHSSQRGSFDFIETCESISGSMSLSRCQLFEAGFPSDILHLNDPNCRGTVRNGRVEFYFDNNDHICGTSLVANGTHFIYDNFILGESGSGNIIRRGKNLRIHFSCVYSQTLSLSMDINPLESIVHRNLPAGQGTYRVRMIPYQDAEFTRPFTGSVNVELDRRIFVEVRVDGVDSHQFASVIDTCWATPVNDPHYSVRWDLIVDMCPSPNDSVELLQNGVSTSSRFSFSMFMFTTNSTKVYLHCTIHLCLLSDSRCSMHCDSEQGVREGRSVDFHDSTSVSMGPFMWADSNKENASIKEAAKLVYMSH